MYQSDRGNFKTTDSVGKAFMHSCLGRLIMLAVVIIVGLIIAYFTTPTEKKMQKEITDNIMQCLQENDSIKGDDIDDDVNNFGFIFTEADTTKIAEDTRKAYHMYNRLEVYRQTFYATTHLRNNLHPEGIRVGFGVFGLVIPTINYKDILLDVGPVHKGYNQKIIQPTNNNEVDLGSNPNIQEYHYKSNPDD